MNGVLDVTHILIPKQTGNSFSCTTYDEDDLAFYQLEHELMTVGWIHVTQYKSFIILLTEEIVLTDSSLSRLFSVKC